MGKRIKVTGYLHVADSEYDDGPLGPLTEDAHDRWLDTLMEVGVDGVGFHFANEGVAS